MDPDNSRLDADLGGHPLLDVGIYCVNAARYLFRAEPTEVTAYVATGADPKFKEVPEMVSAILRFPGERLATFVCGFGEAKTSAYQVLGTKGDLRLDPAFAHRGERTMTISVDGKSKETEFPDGDQIAPEIVYFSDCIGKGQRPEPDGREGLIDLWIIEAIKSSAHERDGGAAATRSGKAAAGQGAADHEATQTGRAGVGKCGPAGRLIES